MRFWGIIEAYFRDDPLKIDRPAIRLIWGGGDSPYEREGRTIYRVRPGDEGQMVVVERSGKRVETLHGSLQRKVMRFGTMRTMQKRGDFRIFLRPITYKSSSARDRYSLASPQAYGRFIYATYPSGLIPPLGKTGVRLVAHASLQDRRPHPNSTNLVILIFQSESTHITVMHLQIVDLKAWLGERFAKFNTYMPDSILHQLSKLPVVIETYENPGLIEVARCIRELGMLYDPSVGASSITSDGVQVNAWLKRKYS
ncbi:hypothetical protein F5Y03DRAFT_15084 [Xylaria venustula]|nr:hypothetical protein F5Y03DRAFT_15084 [Xylaria venustula]